MNGLNDLNGNLDVQLFRPVVITARARGSTFLREQAIDCRQIISGENNFGGADIFLQVRNSMSPWYRHEVFTLMKNPRQR